MKDLNCSLIDFVTAPVPEERICEPEICFEWVVTDPNKIVTIDGEDVEAVLKKSVLGCLRGGMIEVVHNGQMSGDDEAEKALQEIEKSKPEKKQSIWRKIDNGIKGAANFGEDMWRTGANALENGGKKMAKQFQKVGDGILDISDRIADGCKDVEKKIEEIIQKKWKKR